MWGQGPISFFCMWSSSSICWWYYFFPIEWSQHLCQKSAHLRCMGLFLVSIFLSLYLCLSICQYHIVLSTVVLKNKVWNGETHVLQHRSFQDCFCYLGFFEIPHEFWDQLFHFCKKGFWDFHRNYIKSEMALRNITILTILKLQICEHKISFHYLL